MLSFLEQQPGNVVHGVKLRAAFDTLLGNEWIGRRIAGFQSSESLIPPLKYNLKLGVTVESFSYYCPRMFELMRSTLSRLVEKMSSLRANFPKPLRSQW